VVRRAAGDHPRGDRPVCPTGRTTRDWDFSPLGAFDLVTLCDVLEHVEHERPAVDAVYDALKPGGVALVTVPALMSLWGPHDVANHHFRRYTKKTLRPLFDDGRWDVLRLTYFSSLLLPAIWGARAMKRARGSNGHDIAFGNPVVDGTLKAIFRLERPWLAVGSFPLGSSLLLVCRKK
jgi:SAM-dependent methyltransferase